ncbi:MAG: AraC family transcriptional regulator ligand-binding domain-containing protein [Maricaulaceae bacterium]
MGVKTLVSSKAFISVDILRGIHRTAHELNIAINPFLEKHGITKSNLQDRKGIVPFTSVADLLEDISLTQNIEDFGLKLGVNQPPLQFGLLKEILVHSPNVGSALDNAFENAHVYNQSAFWDYKIQDGVVTLSRHFKVLHTRPMPQYLVLTVAVMTKGLRQFCGEKWKPNAIHFSSAAPSDLKLFHNYFRAPVHFNSDFTGLVFDEKTLALRNPNADPKTLAVLTRHLKQNIPDLTDEKYWEESLKNYIRSQIGTGFNRLEFFARHMGLNVRTVQRQLASRNLSFRRALLEIRIEIAKHYLINSKCSLSEIAYILGYENASALSRAFSNLTHGMSPHDFRLAHRFN